MFKTNKNGEKSLGCGFYGTVYLITIIVIFAAAIYIVVKTNSGVAI